MPETDDHVVNEALASVVRDHGWRVTTDPPRLRASLSDVLGPAADDHRGLVDALVVSAEEGTPREIREAGRESVAERRDELVGALEVWGLSTQTAAWVVDAWTALLPSRTDVPPETAVPQPQATELPASRPGGGLAAGAAAAPTEVPVPPVVASDGDPHTPSEKSSGGRRKIVIGVVAAALLAAGTGGAIALSHRGGSAHDTGPGTTSHSPAPGTPLAVGRVVSAPKAHPAHASRRSVMAGRSGGVRLTAFGTVDSVGSGSSMLMPADGGSLVAFTLEDWCPTSGCKSWSRLGLRVAVGGSARTLPHGQDTFVVSVPRGERDVALVLPGAGKDQTLSLVNGRPGPANITVLTRRLTPRTVAAGADSVARTTLSFPYPGVGQTDTVTRHVVVQSVQLGYFVGSLTPRDPGHALLFVHAYYDLRAYGDTVHNGMRRDELHFQPAGGRATAPLTDPVSGHDGTLVYVFEVPGGVTRGAVVVGGQGLPRVITADQASAGVPAGRSYTLSLSTARIPVRLG